MGVYANKLRVNFSDESSVDFDKLLHDLQSEYCIGFAGLFKVEKGISLFVQNFLARMMSGKIKDICAKVAAVVEVVPFDKCQGELIESFGKLRAYQMGYSYSKALSLAMKDNGITKNSPGGVSCLCRAPVKKVGKKRRRESHWDKMC